jgi:hypothetical protein
VIEFILYGGVLLVPLQSIAHNLRNAKIGLAIGKLLDCLFHVSVPVVNMT